MSGRPWPDRPTAGFWAVLVDGADALVEAAALAVVTEHVILAVVLDTAAEHPFTLAEEISVLDHLIDGEPSLWPKALKCPVSGHGWLVRSSTALPSRRLLRRPR